MPIPEKIETLSVAYSSTLPQILKMELSKWPILSIFRAIFVIPV